MIIKIFDNKMFYKIIGSDSNVATQLFLLCGHYCFVCFYRLFNMYWVFMRPKSQQHPSMRNVAVKHTQLLANHSSGRLLPSLQFTTPSQTERSDEGG